MLTSSKRVEGGCHHLRRVERGSHRFRQQFGRPDDSLGGAEKGGGRSGAASSEQRHASSSSAVLRLPFFVLYPSFSFFMLRHCSTSSASLFHQFHVARRQVRVARISSFNLKIILTIPAKVVVSYDFPSLSVVRSASAAYRVEFLVAWRAMMTPPIARRNEDAGEKRAKAVWAT